jgi:hypothetical protein
VYARVGNQRSHDVVTARVRFDAVRSLHHQHRDLHQSTYPIPLGRSGLILLSLDAPASPISILIILISCSSIPNNVSSWDIAHFIRDTSVLTCPPIKFTHLEMFLMNMFFPSPHLTPMQVLPTELKLPFILLCFLI